MNLEATIESLQSLNRDSVIQNLIAQANARYILLNTKEDQESFPPYTIRDDKLNILAFHYLTLGCRLVENKRSTLGFPSIKKGASILEYINGAPYDRKNINNYFALISALSYYVCFEYSKSFILIKKTENDTVIARLISKFLKRDYSSLLSDINELLVDENYNDEAISKSEDFIEADKKIYELIIAKALSHFVNYFFSGNLELLDLAKASLKSLKEIAEIKKEPEIWWVIRLLILISDGISDASLWNSLEGYFNLSGGKAKKYIHSLTFQRGRGIYELFLTQKKALPKVLNTENRGCIVTIPTSSGKTRIAEIAILDCLSKSEESKVLYIAPFRSLAFEIENSLDSIFHNLDVTVSQLYGGSLFNKLDEKVIEESRVIVATPEKSKALLRSSKEILDQIDLVVIDEGHLLGANDRLIVNELFYEELRHFIEKNQGIFLLLSAVLPNSEDLAQWLTGSEETVYKENWRPSDERLGILRWNGTTVSLDWQSDDPERNSFNPHFIVAEELPRKKRQTKPKYFPDSKNQAVATTAYKLRDLGPVLIFVGQKRSVFTIAREYFKALGDNPEDFEWDNQADWRAFQLACTENYGEDCDWLKYAEKGIICHNSDLHADVRLPLERLMRKDKPLVIIATSTLGQGVNLGVSTVIFSTIYQGGPRGPRKITSRDFWNIAGRAGRAFVDHEGKILVALDTSDQSTWEARNKIMRRENQIREYFDKRKIDYAKSGLFELIKEVKEIAEENNIDFDLLLQLIAENNATDINIVDEKITNDLDLIDDALLALHTAKTENDKVVNYDWVDIFFRNSLAYVQSSSSVEVSGEEVLNFITARTKGIISKIGEDRDRWKSIVNSGISLNNNLQIEEKLPDIIELAQQYLASEKSIEDKIRLLKQVEETINGINALADDYLSSEDLDIIRSHWLSGSAMSEITTLENTTDIISKHYSYRLPWILNGISKKLKHKDLINESDVLEELSILVELGLPNLKSVKIYQSGIRSRVAAKEIGSLFDDELWDKSINTYKNTLIEKSDFYKDKLSEEAFEWITLLAKSSKRGKIKVISVPDFPFIEAAYEGVDTLVARKINNKQYLMSLDLDKIYRFKEDIDFSSVNNVNGVYFKHDLNDMSWKVSNDNPYLQFK